jgi:hypothetical protein
VWSTCLEIEAELRMTLYPTIFSIVLDLSWEKRDINDAYFMA